MITLDTLKIHADIDVINDIDLSKFDTEIRKKSDGTFKKDWLRSDGVCCGLKSIILDNVNQKLIFEMSAKILKDDYYGLININTIDQVFDIINGTGTINVDKSKIDRFDILRMDVTQNVKCEYTPAQVIETCYKYVDHRYHVTPYKQRISRNDLESVIMKGKQKKAGPRMQIYNKHIEMKSDKMLKESCKDFNKMHESFRNVARAETNILTWAKIREHTNTDRNLIEVLESDSLPLPRVFKKMVYFDVKVQTLFDDDRTLHEIRRYYGDKYILETLSYDLEKLKHWLKSKVKGNPSSYMKSFRDVLQRERMKSSSWNGVDHDKVLETFINHLKQAV